MVLGATMILGATMTEKPLHVQVAEALGWSHFGLGGRLDRPWVGYPPHNPIVGERQEVPRYDIDWGATGPLIFQRRISLEAQHEGAANSWIARAITGTHVWDDDPQIAVCRLVLMPAVEP